MSARPSLANAPIALPAKARILVVTLRRLGDVLLTTPLIRSVNRGRSVVSSFCNSASS